MGENGNWIKYYTHSHLSLCLFIRLLYPDARLQEFEREITVKFILLPS